MESRRRQDGRSDAGAAGADGFRTSDRALNRATRITEAFVGEWTLARSIVDLVHRTTLAALGTAILRRDGDELAYDEAVSFRAGGKLIRATRSYRYLFAEGTIVAKFEDGSAFFSTRLDANGKASASHRCGDDLYALTLTLRAPDVWTTIWEVSGTKRLRLTTDYRK